MLQTKEDGYRKYFGKIHVVELANPFATQWLDTLKYLLLPEDTSMQEGLNRQTTRQVFDNFTCSTAKAILWFTASLIFSLLLGQLT